MNRTPAGARRFRRVIARVLAAGYRNRLDAQVFIAEALDDRIAREGWMAALRITGLCVKDIITTRWQPSGMPITASPVAGGPAAAPRSTVMDRVTQDIWFALRQLFRQPGFAFVAILTLALGVGANTAIFHVAWQAMLKPLPYPDSTRLVEVWETFGGDDRTNLSMPAKFHDLRAEARSFESIAAFSALRSPLDITGGGDPEQLSVRRVTGEYFHVFNMKPLAGRVIVAGDETLDATPVVLSEGLWRRRFEAARDVVGRAVRLSGSPATVIGVMPDAFEMSGGRVDLWTPLTLPPPTARKSGHYLRVVARLAPGVTIAQADAEAKAIAARAAALYPEFEGKLSERVTSLRDGPGTSRGDVATARGLALLALAAGLVLLVACANLASLQLARSASRRREFGIRAALGASRGRLMQQLITEGLIIAVLGSFAGLVLGAWVLGLLSSAAPVAIRPAARGGIDMVVVGYALALALVSAAAFALAPAWRASRRATASLGQRGAGGDRGSSRLRLTLVTTQIASAAMLLIGALLLVGSLINVLARDPGFKAEGALAFDLSVPSTKFNSFDTRHRLFDDVAREVGALPGVTEVCAMYSLPLDGPFNMTYVPEGGTNASAVGSFPNTVTSECFAALGMSIVRGRGFAANERDHVAVVTEGFANTAWPGADPIGQRLHVGVAGGPIVTIVGVVRDTLAASLEGRAYPQILEAWTPEATFQPPSHVIVRAAVRPDTLFSAIRAAVRRADADQPVARLRTMNEIVSENVSSRRFDLTLVASFAVVALFLASIGVYGLLAEVVAQRTAEIGLRLALGATPGSVVQLMLRHAGIALALGVPAGIGGAVLASRLLRRFMFGLSATDPRAYLGVAAALTAIVLLAAWLPARRAARVDPALTLK